MASVAPLRYRTPWLQASAWLQKAERSQGHTVDFVDDLVAVHMGRQGIGKFYSFDSDFDRLPGVTRLVPGR